MQSSSSPIHMYPPSTHTHVLPLVRVGTLRKPTECTLTSTSPNLTSGIRTCRSTKRCLPKPRPPVQCARELPSFIPGPALSFLTMREGLHPTSRNCFLCDLAVCHAHGRELVLTAWLAVRICLLRYLTPRHVESLTPLTLLAPPSLFLPQGTPP